MSVGNTPIDWDGFYQSGKLDEILRARRDVIYRDPYWGTLDFQENPACESPIEAIFAWAFICHETNFSGIDVYWHTGPSGMDLKACDEIFDRYAKDTTCVTLFGPRPKVGLFPQAMVGKFRVDFLAIAQYWAGDDRYNEKRHVFVVECDGHDHHERTKDQAARDRQRDRMLVLSKMPVLRFTGSELWNNPMKCAGEAWELVWRARQA